MIFICTASVQIQPGTSIIGVIDEKLENGYVVSVNLGSDTLKGILYHIPDTPPPSWSPNLTIPRRRKRKKSQLSLVKYATLNPVSEGQDKSVSNIGHTRNQLSEPDKQVKLLPFVFFVPVSALAYPLYLVDIFVKCLLVCVE